MRRLAAVDDLELGWRFSRTRMSWLMIRERCELAAVSARLRVAGAYARSV